MFDTIAKMTGGEVPMCFCDDCKCLSVINNCYAKEKMEVIALNGGLETRGTGANDPISSSVTSARSANVRIIRHGCDN